MAHAGHDRLILRLDPGPALRRRVVVSLHGSGFTADTHNAMVQADELCRNGAIVLTPQALLPFRYGAILPEGFAWNVPGSPLPGEDTPRDDPDDPDDVALITTLLKATRARHPDLPVHLLGYSGGARLASHVLAVDQTATSAGLVAGVLFPPAAESAVTAVLAIHGRHDDVNPYDGADGLRWPTGVRRTMQSWAERSGGGATSQVRELEPGVVEQRFDSSDARFGPVRLISLDRVGHSWPGTRDPLCLQQFGPSGAWSATSHLSKFFAEFDGGPAEMGSQIAFPEPRPRQ